MIEDAQQFSNLQFLKLGGSLITDKTRPHTIRAETLARLADEIVQARRAQPDLLLLLGHGSGSFGHVPARKYGTRQGVHTSGEWQGFVEVWREAMALNRMVMDALAEAGLPALAFAPLSSVVAADGVATSWSLEPLRVALSAGLLPVVYGDVIFDRERGGTILSTEDLFAYLAVHLRPRRLLLAGLEPGVWADFPACTRLMKRIIPHELEGFSNGIHGSTATDVTGGMLSKVQQSLELVSKIPGLEVYIFSGETPGLVARALAGESVGTLICAPA